MGQRAGSLEDGGTPCLKRLVGSKRKLGKEQEELRAVGLLESCTEGLGPSPVGRVYTLRTVSRNPFHCNL